MLLLFACNAMEPVDSSVAVDSSEPVDSVPSIDSGEPAAPEGALVFSGDPPVNVVVVTLDTSRYDYYGYFTGDAEHSPFLTARMNEGVVLANHRSCSNATPDSIPCLMLGGPGLEQGYVARVEGTSWRKVDEELELAPEIFSAAGYQTMLASAHAGTSPGFGTAQGFTDVYFEDNTIAELMVGEALAMSTELVEPFFLNVHLLDTHAPYNPPADYLDALDDLDELPYDLSRSTGTSALAAEWSGLSEEEQALALAHIDVRYRAAVRYLDDQVGRLVVGLEEQGLMDRTLLLVWSDHGEELLEREELGHGSTMYDAAQRALAFFWAPGLEHVHWTGPTQHGDLMPTVMQAVGLEPAATSSGQLVGTRSEQDPLYAYKYLEHQSTLMVVKGDHKLHYGWGGTAMLFDVASDPNEDMDLLASEPELASELWDLLEPRVRAIEAMYPDPPAGDPGL